MKKSKLSSTDIGYLIIDLMKDAGAIPGPISLAVVPDGKTGWRSIVGRRTKLTPAGRRALASIERRLQATVDLA
jgi:hypothetical protein